jgi:hypothetical protein
VWQALSKIVNFNGIMMIHAQQGHGGSLPSFSYNNPNWDTIGLAIMAYHEVD